MQLVRKLNFFTLISFNALLYRSLLYNLNFSDPKTGKALYGQKVDVLPTSKATVPDFE